MSRAATAWRDRDVDRLRLGPIHLADLGLCGKLELIDDDLRLRRQSDGREPRLADEADERDLLAFGAGAERENGRSASAFGVSFTSSFVARRVS